MARFLFPRWSNKVLPFTIFFVLGPLGTAALGALWYYGSPKHMEVGYQPVQPVPYSHKLHAGDLGIDCRYCHTTVEQSAFSQVPPTETCMNCHSKVRTESLKLQPVRESFATGQPIPWVRVHNLPDYAFFDHSAHMAAGVGCKSCHGRVDQMIEVIVSQPISMAWCIECHRDPRAHVRDLSKTTVTNMDWEPSAEQLAASGPVKATNGREVAPPVHCSGCHR